MEKTRLIEVLRSFDKKELRELKKWLHSPQPNVFAVWNLCAGPVAAKNDAMRALRMSRSKTSRPPMPIASMES